MLLNALTKNNENVLHETYWIVKSAGKVCSKKEIIYMSYP